MKIVGLTGGIGSGKSTVAKMLVKRGARLIDADVLAREVVEPDRPAWKEIVAEFGKGVLNPDRTIDRQALAEIVFGDEKKRERLNHITHPRVGEEMIRLSKKYDAEGADVTIIDAALLFESAATRWIRPVIVVAADEEVRVKRVCERDGTCAGDVEKRIRSQMPDEEKKKLADFVIDNSGGLESLEEQVDEVWGKLLDLARDQAT